MRGGAAGAFGVSTEARMNMHERRSTKLHGTALSFSFALVAVVAACSDASPAVDDAQAVEAEYRGRHDFCGNHRCGQRETCATCPTDCGACVVDAGEHADASKADSGGGGPADASADVAVDAGGGGGASYPSVPLPATGLNYFVSASKGADTNPGTAASPWKTIQHAASTVSHGATGVTVHVAPGTYAEGLAMSVGGTATARVIFVSDTRWGAHVNATGHYWGWQSTGDYVDIVGFELTGSDYIGIGIGGSHDRTIDNHVHHLAAPTCNSGSGGGGIDDYEYSASDDEMIGNVVHDIGKPGCTQIQGLYHSNLGGRLVNNIVYRISGFGLHTWHNPKNVVISNNLSFQNGAGGLVVGAGDSPGTGKAEGFVVTNNILFDNLGSGMVEEGNYGVNTYVGNLAFKNAGGNTLLANPSTGELAIDPGFVDYKADGSGDYHLTDASPCRNSGTPQGAPSADIVGAPRPQGPKVDRGPYERP